MQVIWSPASFASGALVLMSLDNAAIQQFSWAYMLWPSLLLCLGVMLPISAATNWLRRNRQFDWPGSSNPAVTMRQKEKEYNTQQQKKADLLQRHAAMMLTDRVFVPLTQQLAAQMRGTVFRLAGLSKAIADYQKKQSLEKQWKLWQKQDTSDQDSGNVSRCGPVANTDGSLSKRPWKEHDRRLVSEVARRQIKSFGRMPASDVLHTTVTFDESPRHLVTSTFQARLSVLPAIMICSTLETEQFTLLSTSSKPAL